MYCSDRGRIIIKRGLPSGNSEPLTKAFSIPQREYKDERICTFSGWNPKAWDEFSLMPPWAITGTLKALRVSRTFEPIHCPIYSNSADQVYPCNQLEGIGRSFYKNEYQSFWNLKVMFSLFLLDQRSALHRKILSIYYWRSSAPNGACSNDW